MRMSLTLFILWIVTFNSYAQKKQSLHVGTHYFNLEDTKFAFDFINIGYQKDLSSRFNWDTSLGFISYSREDQIPVIRGNNLIIDQKSNFFNDFTQTSILALNSRIGYSFINKTKNKIGIALGFTSVYAIENRFASGNAFYEPSTGLINSSTYTTYEKNFDIGYTPKLYIERKINSNFSIEGAAEIYFHLRNEVAYIYALGLRLNYNLKSKNRSKANTDTPQR